MILLHNAKHLAVELSLPVLTTYFRRGWDSKTQPLACGANALTYCTNAATQTNNDSILTNLHFFFLVACLGFNVSYIGECLFSPKYNPEKQKFCVSAVMFSMRPEGGAANTETSFSSGTAFFWYFD